MRVLLLALALLLAPIGVSYAQVVSYTQAAGTITAGNTFQTVIPAGINRQSCVIQNTSTRVLYVFVGTLANATTANSFQVPANGGFFYCGPPGGYTPPQAVNVTTTTTADPFVVGYTQ